MGQAARVWPKVKDSWSWLTSAELDEVDVAGMRPAHIRIAVLTLRVLAGVLAFVGWMLEPWFWTHILLFPSWIAVVVAVLALERALVRKLRAGPYA